MKLAFDAQREFLVTVSRSKQPAPVGDNTFEMYNLNFSEIIICIFFHSLKLG